MTPPDDVQITKSAKQYTKSRLVVTGRALAGKCGPLDDTVPVALSLRVGVSIIGELVLAVVVLVISVMVAGLSTAEPPARQRCGLPDERAGEFHG